MLNYDYINLFIICLILVAIFVVILRYIYFIILLKKENNKIQNLRFNEIYRDI